MFVPDDILSFVEYECLVKYLMKNISVKHCKSICDKWWKLSREGRNIPEASEERPLLRGSANNVAIQQDVAMKEMERFAQPLVKFINNNYRKYHHHMLLIWSEAQALNTGELDLEEESRPSSFVIVAPLNGNLYLNTRMSSTRQISNTTYRQSLYKYNADDMNSYWANDKLQAQPQFNLQFVFYFAD
jgi:hypothetical protein